MNNNIITKTKRTKSRIDLGEDFETEVHNRTHMCLCGNPTISDFNDRYYKVDRRYVYDKGLGFVECSKCHLSYRLIPREWVADYVVKDKLKIYTVDYKKSENYNRWDMVRYHRPLGRLGL